MASNTGSRRQSTPHLVGRRADGQLDAHVLPRRPFDRLDIDEGWLQTLIFQHPALLTIEEIEPDHGPLIPLGREVPTDAGPIDCLYIAPNGLLTLVEAKLWKNPDARREVVGQIIDYAKQLAGWTYAELNSYARDQGGQGLWELVSQRAELALELDEAEFVDAVNRNLQRGRFLLLIVGDGIKERVEELAGYLQGAQNLRFTLALIEMRVYDMPASTDLLVVPSVVARTREVVRAVIDLRDPGGTIRVSTIDDERPARLGTATRSRIDDGEFFDAIREHVGSDGEAAARWFLKAAEERGLTIDARSANVMVKIPDPNGSGKVFNLFGISKYGIFVVGWLARQTVAAGIEFRGSAAETYLRTVTAVFGTDLAAPGKSSPFPEFLREKPTVVEAFAKREAFTLALDAYLSTLRGQVDEPVEHEGEGA